MNRFLLWFVVMLFPAALGVVYHFGFRALEGEALGRAEALVAQDRERARDRLLAYGEQGTLELAQVAARTAVGRLLATRVEVPLVLERVATPPRKRAKAAPAAPPPVVRVPGTLDESTRKAIAGALEQDAVPGQLLVVCGASGQVLVRARQAGPNLQPEACREAAKGRSVSQPLVYRGNLYQVSATPLFVAGRIVGALAIGRLMQDELLRGLTGSAALSLHGKLVASNLDARLRNDLQAKVADLEPRASHVVMLGEQPHVAQRWDLPRVAGASVIHLLSHASALAGVEVLRKGFLAGSAALLGLVLIVALIIERSLRHPTTTLVARVRAAGDSDHASVSAEGLPKLWRDIALEVNAALRRARDRVEDRRGPSPSTRGPSGSPPTGAPEASPPVLTPPAAAASLGMAIAATAPREPTPTRNTAPVPFGAVPSAVVSHAAHRAPQAGPAPITGLARMPPARTLRQTSAVAQSRSPREIGLSGQQAATNPVVVDERDAPAPVPVVPLYPRLATSEAFAGIEGVPAQKPAQPTSSGPSSTRPSVAFVFVDPPDKR